MYGQPSFFSLATLAVLTVTVTAQASNTTTDECGPFYINTNRGRIFPTDNGTQYPTWDFQPIGLNGSAFYFDDRGLLYNETGSECGFQPYLTCSIDRSAFINRFSFYNNASFILYYGSSDTFQLCPRSALSNESTSDNDDYEYDVVIMPPKGYESTDQPYDDTFCAPLLIQPLGCPDYPVPPRSNEPAAASGAQAIRLGSTSSMIGTLLVLMGLSIGIFDGLGR